VPGSVLEPIRICASYKPKGTSGNWVKSSEQLKKELAEEEQDGYDAGHEHLPVGSESRILRWALRVPWVEAKGNPLSRLDVDAVIDWEGFRPLLEQALARYEQIVRLMLLPRTVA